MDPATKKKSVDEIWKELNAKSRAQAVPRSATTGIPGFGIPGVQTHTRVLPSKPQKPAPSGLSTLQKQLQQSGQPAQQPTFQTAQYDPAAAGLTQEQVQQYLSTLQRTINCLSDPDRGTRRTAAGSLHTKLVKGDAITQKASPAMLQVRLTQVLLDWASCMSAQRACCLYAACFKVRVLLTRLWCEIHGHRHSSCLDTSA